MVGIVVVETGEDYLFRIVFVVPIFVLEKNEAAALGALYSIVK